jgi:folate-binding protein YgfZ
MTSRLFTRLETRGLLEIDGPDALKFLQSLLTNEPPEAEGTARYAALLTPQGKVISDFVVYRQAGAFLLDCPAPLTQTLVDQLQKYRLRSRVTISDRMTERAVLALSHAPQTMPVDGILNADPRLAELGFRLVLPRAGIPGWIAISGFEERAGDAWRRECIRLGVPDFAEDIETASWFALDCNMDELHGIDFGKGCYVGQELTSRMKHRATSRRRMLPVSGDTVLPGPGTPVTLGDIDIGEMRGSLNEVGFAAIRMDRLQEATTATCGGQTITIGRPAYPLGLGAGE